jgi:hypothetical protein
MPEKVRKSTNLPSAPEDNFPEQPQTKLSSLSLTVFLFFC